MDKVIWSEGMFLRPQHFQQFDRYLENQLVTRCQHLSPYCWGFSQLEFDESLLAFGKLAILSAAGILPDGTLFKVNYDPAYPLLIQLNKSQENQTIYLTIPPKMKGVVDSDDDETSRGIRYRLTPADIRDSHGVNNERSYPISTGILKVGLLTEDQLDDSLISMPLARIHDIQTDGSVVLDTSFGVPAINFSVNTPCMAELSELSALMKKKAKQLAASVKSGKGNGAGTVVDLLMLQALNRWGAQLTILVRQTPLHPYELFKHLVSLISEVSTYTLAERLPAGEYEYQHMESAALITQLIATARVLVSTAFKSAATSLPIQRKKFGISLVGLSNQSMVEDAEFILAIKADISTDKIRSLVSNKLKAGSIENIKDLVNLQLPGCMKELLPVTPRQIPYHSGMHYFRLSPDADMRASIKRSSGMGLHVSGDVPGVEMEFWVIPSGTSGSEDKD
jgi:type VI secretion system protein ImpJ